MIATFEGINHVSPTKVFTPGVIIILGLSIAGFLLSLFSNSMAQAMMLQPSSLWSGKIWQLVTYPFINYPQSLIFNGLIVLFIGSAIEREWRTRSFLYLWLVVSVVSGLIWAAVCSIIGKDYLGAGASACIYGLLGAFGLIFRGTNCFVFFGMLKAQMITWICLAVGVIMNLAAPITLVWLLGAAVAYGYVKLVWKMASQKKVTSPAKTSGSFVEID